MEFIKSVIKNRKLIWQLGRNDFKNRFASTSLGSIWGFLQPFVFMFTYVIVFQYILKTRRSEEYPYLVMSASMSIRNYSYLVKKVVFPVDIIPMISIVASSFVGLFLMLVALITCMIFKYFPNVLEMIYVIIAFYAFIIAFTRFTSAITTLVPDFANLLGIVMQLFFWFTPIIWNLSMLENHHTLLTIMKCTPFTYLVSAYREVFIDGNIISENNFAFTIAFWVITIVMFLWGNSVLKKKKKDFADVL